MKGIRKLFFGLIFMTLIGVGFKIDVKAAPTISFVLPTNGEGKQDWSVGGLQANLTVEATDWPEITDGTGRVWYTYKFDVVNSNDPTKKLLENVKISLYTKSDNTYCIHVGDGEPVDGDFSLTKPTSKTSFLSAPVSASSGSIISGGGKSLVASQQLRIENL